MNNDCPSNDFKQGEPQGKCWGNGHYQCKECIYYRKDFKEHGQKLIDYLHEIQGQIQITTFL
jgi:hypothetical protein